jgi:hypothetical protein
MADWRCSYCGSRNVKVIEAGTDTRLRYDVDTCVICNSCGKKEWF